MLYIICYSLQQALTAFIQYSSIGDDETRVYRLLEELPTLPEELLVKHSAKAWCYIWTRFTTPSN